MFGVEAIDQDAQRCAAASEDPDMIAGEVRGQQQIPPRSLVLIKCVSFYISSILRSAISSINIYLPGRERGWQNLYRQPGREPMFRNETNSAAHALTFLAHPVQFNSSYTQILQVMCSVLHCERWLHKSASMCRGMRFVLGSSLSTRHSTVAHLDCITLIAS